MARHPILVTLLVAATSSFSLAYPSHSGYGQTSYDAVNTRALTNNFEPYPSSDVDQRDRMLSPIQSADYQQSDRDINLDDYYMDDEAPAMRATEHEITYGKPTYHGEYNPNRFYYARPQPSLSQYDDVEVGEDGNPLDEWHDQMVKESRTRYLNYPVGKPQWFQNTGMPDTYSTNVIKNLMLLNQGIDPDALTLPEYYANTNRRMDHTAHAALRPSEYGQAAAMPYDFYDELAVQQPYNRFESPSSFDNPNYFRFAGDNKQTVAADMPTARTAAVAAVTPPKLTAQQEADKDEQELFALREQSKGGKPKAKQGKQGKQGKQAKQSKGSKNNNRAKLATTSTSDHGFEDVDDDTWINWNRKRSYAVEHPNVMSPLKALQFQLMGAMQPQESHNEAAMMAEAVTEATSTTSTTSTATSNRYLVV